MQNAIVSFVVVVKPMMYFNVIDVSRDNSQELDKQKNSSSMTNHPPCPRR